MMGGSSSRQLVVGREWTGRVIACFNCFALRLNPFCDSPEAPELHLYTSACLPSSQVRGTGRPEMILVLPVTIVVRLLSFSGLPVFSSIKWRQ